MDVGEEQRGLTAGGVVEADAFAAEGFADVVVATFMREVPAGGNDFDLEVLGIDQRLVVLVEASRTVMVEIGRTLHLQSLMGAVVIIAVAPAVEAALLGRESW